MSGSDANRSGRVFERAICAILEASGIAFHAQYRTDYVSQLGKIIRSDVFLPRPVGFEGGLHVEARWQDSPGSADEKIYSLEKNIFTSYRRPAVVVIDGESVQPQLDYMTGLIDNKKLVAVFRLVGFMRFCGKLAGDGMVSLARREFDPNQKTIFQVA